MIAVILIEGDELSALVKSLSKIYPGISEPAELLRAALLDIDGHLRGAEMTRLFREEIAARGLKTEGLNGYPNNVSAAGATGAAGARNGAGINNKAG